MAKGFNFKSPDKKTYKLTEKEKAFCEIYANFGVSGIEAAKLAGYKANNANTFYSIASENLRKPKIMDYIAELYKEFKFTDEEVMREHLYLLKQHSSLSSKARAIDMYYKKRGLYSPDTLEKQNKVTVVKIIKYEGE